MEKMMIAGFLAISLFALSGCNSDEAIVLDLEKIEEKVSELNDGVFSLTIINTDSMEEFSEPLAYIYDFEYEKYFGLSSDSIDGNNSSIKYNQDTNELLAIISATDEEDVTSSMEKFCEDLECLNSEYEDYLIYIVSSDNEEVLKEVKNSNTPIFNEMMDVDGEFLETLTEIKESELEEYLVKVPMMMTSSATYFILKPSEDNYDNVKSLMDKYISSLEETWEMYLPDQYDLVKNRLEKEIDGYLIYIISSDNELVYETIIG